ncbi:hypothetical protein [Maribacter polysaccharolyticus]|uniref:hypothetical protein n=1 Tax=Maribacter polysaccharolyticus TaxID=3020831 RepID=UPI00237F7E36|nr:hypothetical protein [Maribacter polysaccharolyticus]MDE3743902.1 hypothetical protein [Maribacter polysaccharolyticus]
MRITTFLLFSLLCMGCKTEKKEAKPTPEKAFTIVEKIANAHGFQEWKNVGELRFTFNVDRDSSHFERSWIWDINNNQVTAISQKDTVTYHRAQLDSITDKINGKFINDKYWLLAPFNLVWDKGNYTYEHYENEVAPLSHKTMHKVTLVYGNEGGYTPGDAYDLYFGDDYRIQEWVFRKGNSPEASLVTIWEDYADINGLQISRKRSNDKGFLLYFTHLAAQKK